MSQYTMIYKYGKRARQLKIKRELKYFPSRNKQFCIVAGPALTEANKMLHAFVRKSDKISGVVHKKATSKQQVEKHFQSGELTWSGGHQRYSTASYNSMVLPWHILQKTWYRKSATHETCHARPQSYSTRRRVF